MVKYFTEIHFRQILDSSKLKWFADDNSEFDENGKKFSKRVENTGWKGEIGCFEQFLLFLLCLQGLVLPWWLSDGRVRLLTTWL